MKLTLEKLDNIVNDPRCTLAHKIVISGRIERGDWIIGKTLPGIAALEESRRLFW